MKALSIRQPWAWAILCAGKRIENRCWYCSYRGPILIHASKGCTRQEWLDAANFMRLGPLPGSDRISRPVSIPGLQELDRGGIVGRARVVDCICPSDEDHKLYRNPWYVGEFGLVLADVVALPFVPYKGALGLFEVPASALEARA